MDVVHKYNYVGVIKFGNCLTVSSVFVEVAGGAVIKTFGFYIKIV